jgi:hypothetical protein
MRRKLRALSDDMVACLLAAQQHGKLIRLPGGFWTFDGCPRHVHNGEPHVYFRPTTIMGLIARERLEYVAWQDGKRGRIAVAAAPIGETAAARPCVSDDLLMAG